jgi:integrase
VPKIGSGRRLPEKRTIGAPSGLTEAASQRRATGETCRDLGDVRLHDLRHSFASVIASAGGSLLVAKLLGHRDSKTTQKYAHLFEDTVRLAADATAGQIAAWMTPNADDTKVTPISMATA